MADTLITSEVNLDALGGQTGFLRVPHSVTRSAYGWLPVPISVVNNGKGPTVLLMAGNHGDEYEGQIAIARLCRDLTPDQIQGRIILLPQANAPAAQAGTRTSPIDNGNLNRTFPGDPKGTPTEMIAHYIEEVLLPLCDYAVDLHSGGASLFYPPTLLRNQGHTPEAAAALEQLETAFDLPYAWVFQGGGGPGSTARTALGAANRKGVICVMAELGGAGAVDRDILAQTERGLKRVLHSLGLLPGYAPDAVRGTRRAATKGSVYAYDTGLFEPFKDIGEDVTVGEIVGLIHLVDTPWCGPIPVHSPYDGFVLCNRPLAQVQRGDALFQVADDVA
ncbi:succinylglutamate desuccinylase/aspartoacylase family protein [Falsiphaeobacter marinintestinus]|uniref:succinylglutamate desuccinylase/aspartoacylase family protein n=1 Tax=Falsiphaeobacter marinintestinus TaxID=1492905 RepID=UPI0011B42E68|nr:succinylglutamate desuccinylase/aspartoacylase family protein [Phaeobacter marinintestinus]